MQTSHICGSPYLPTSDDWVLHTFPFFLFAFLRVGGGGVVNCAVVGAWFRFLDISADASLMIEFVDS